MLELDRLLNRFIERHYQAMNEADSAILLRLLALEDDQLWAALQGRAVDVLDSRMNQLVERIRQYD